MRRCTMIFLLIIVLFISATAVRADRTHIFTTFRKGKQMGMYHSIKFDGSSYWFSSMLGGEVMRYNPQNGKFSALNFNRGDVLEGVSGITVAHNQVWFGLWTFGVGVYDLKTNKMSYYNAENGLNYFTRPNGTRISKVSVIAYDSLSDKIWVGLVRAGITAFDFDSKKWMPIRDELVTNLDVVGLAIDKDVIAVNDKRNAFYFRKGKWINCIKAQEDELQNLIIKNGVLLYVLRNGSVWEYDINKKMNRRLFKHETYLNTIEHYRHYLVFTSKLGVTFYNRVSKKQKTFTTAHGLVSNWADNIYFDEPANKMWVLTQDGISSAKLTDVLRELKAIESNKK